MEVWSTRAPQDEFESQVLDLLAHSSLPGIALNNVILPHPSPNPSFCRLPNEHDILVFTDGHLFTLDMKALDPGLYRGSEGRLIEHSEDGVEWKPVPNHLDPYETAFKKGRVLESFFRTQFPSTSTPSFVTVIVVPDAANIDALAAPNGRTPLGTRMLISRISDLEEVIQHDLTSAPQRKPKAGEIADLFQARRGELAQVLPCWVSEHLRLEALIAQPKRPVPRTCYRGYDGRREAAVRVEIIPRFTGQLTANDARRAFRSNIRTLSELSHPSLLRHYSEFELHRAFVIVSEYFSEVTLLEFMREARTWPLLRGIFAQAVDVLRSAHAAQIVHRHLDLECILIGSDATPRIRVTGFFGASIGSLSVVHCPDHSNPFQAPEYEETQTGVTPMEDAFAIGRCLCAALTGDPRRLPSATDSPINIDILSSLMDTSPTRRQAAWNSLPRLLT